MRTQYDFTGGVRGKYKPVPAVWYPTQLASGKLEQICWLDRRLKPGQVVRLVGDPYKWTVVEQYAPGEPGRRRWTVEKIEH